MESKIIIAGSGRAGTTFLVGLLTELGLDTGFEKGNYDQHVASESKGGLEYGSVQAKPYILKNPTFSLMIPEIIKEVKVDMVYIPVREIKEASNSRIMYGNRQGGLWQTDKNEEQYEKIGFTVGKVVSDIVENNIPYELISFSQMTKDPKYLFDKLKFALKDISFETFYSAYIQLGKRFRTTSFSIPPSVIWITGLSSSGKTTLANALHSKIVNKNKCVILDGDEVRKAFELNKFDKDSRILHNLNVGRIASLLEAQGFTVIVSLISPYKEVRDKCRTLAKKFVEVYLNTPVEICESRDTKGLYAKARNGEIQDFTGVNSPYETPDNPELTFDTSGNDLYERVTAILNHLSLKK